MILDLGCCVLRPWRWGDEASLAQHANNRAVSRNLRDRFPYPYTLEDASAWIGYNVDAEDLTSFAITVDDAAVGGIGLMLRSDVDRRTAEIGYWLGEAYWGRGIATAAVKAFTEWAFATFDLVRLEASVYEWNPASARVLEKAGYSLEGRLRKSVTKEGKTIDRLLYARIRDEWLRRTRDEEMSSEEALPPGIEIVPAAPEQEPVLANLLELYAHDFSEFIDLRLQPDGRFGYSGLSRYWQEEGRFPFLVTVNGELAGFVLVSRGSHIRHAPEVWDMAEFFIVRRYRKRGIGAAVAWETWRRFPGTWEVRVMESNRPAQAFWSAAVRRFTGSSVETAIAQQQEKRWQVFTFVSPVMDERP